MKIRFFDISLKCAFQVIIKGPGLTAPGPFGERRRKSNKRVFAGRCVYCIGYYYYNN